MEQIEGRARGPAKTVNRLVRITNREEIACGAGEPGENSNLREVGVLEFVGEDESSPGPRLGQNIFVAVQQGVGACDHVAEGAQILFAEPALHRFEHARNLAASPQDLRVIKNIL